MDSVICCFHAEQIREEIDSLTGVYNAAVIHLCDAFAGEWQEEVKNLDFVLNIVKTLLGPKVTAKIQLTDVRFSKMAKDAGLKVMLSGAGGDEVFGGYGWQKSKFASIYINKAYFEFKSLFYMIKERFLF